MVSGGFDSSNSSPVHIRHKGQTFSTFLRRVFQTGLKRPFSRKLNNPRRRDDDFFVCTEVAHFVLFSGIKAVFIIVIGHLTPRTDRTNIRSTKFRPQFRMECFPTILTFPLQLSSGNPVVQDEGLFPVFPHTFTKCLFARKSVIQCRNASLVRDHSAPYTLNPVSIMKTLTLEVTVVNTAGSRDEDVSHGRGRFAPINGPKG